MMEAEWVKAPTSSCRLMGKKVAQKRIERTIGARFSLDETWDVGEDTGTPVEFNVYDVPFKFNGKLNKLAVDLK